MKKAQVQVGKTYVMKVSGRLAPVQLVAESRFGGWEGRNTVTGRSVRIKSAAKLRREYVKPAPLPNRDAQTDGAADMAAQAALDPQEPTEADLDYAYRVHGGSRVGSLTLEQAAHRAMEIYQGHAEGAEMDAGFDAGEFSGSASDRAADREIEALAQANGFTVEQVDQEVQRIIHLEEATQDNLANYE